MSFQSGRAGSLVKAAVLWEQDDPQPGPGTRPHRRRCCRCHHRRSDIDLQPPACRPEAPVLKEETLYFFLGMCVCVQAISCPTVSVYCGAATTKRPCHRLLSNARKDKIYVFVFFIRLFFTYPAV